MTDEEKKAALAKLKKKPKKKMGDSATTDAADTADTGEDDDAGAKKKPFVKKEIDEDLETKEYVPSGILSWGDWEAYQKASDAAEEIQEATSVFMQLVYNNLWCGEVMDKRKALVSLVNDYALHLDPKAATKEVAEPEDEGKPFLLVKEANGQYRWFAIYSNNLRDDDYPAEIIATKSHKTFTEMAMKGEVPMPELWQWHIPGSRWGIADSLYFGDDGFALATGLVDHGKEAVAEAMLETKETVLVSHGMPKKFIVRDQNDPTVINFHITKEISTLPGNRAANKLTGFSLMTKESDMLDNKRREWLATHGYDADAIKSIEEALQTKGTEGQGRESKEATPAPEPEKTVTPVAQTPVAEADKPVVKEDKAEEPGSPMQLKELLDAVVGVLRPLAERMGALEATVKELSTAQAGQADVLANKAKKMIDETPALSLKELMAMAVFGPESRVDGRSVLANDKPVEKDANLPPNTGGVTGISFLDALIQTSQKSVGG
jgi:hypothetical protein